MTLFPTHTPTHRGRGQRPDRHPFPVVQVRATVGMRDGPRFTHHVYLTFSIAPSGLLDRLCPFQKNRYAIDFRAADDIYRHGRVAASTSTRTKYWSHWATYVAPLGLDPYLQTTIFAHRSRALSGFAARVRAGYYGRGNQITAAAVASALTAIGTTIALATGCNPTKLENSDKLIPRLSQMLDGMRREDPPTMKKLPVEADVPHFLGDLSRTSAASPIDHAIGDLAIIAFYYLLRVGEYTTKNARNDTKRTVQFRVQDVTFFTSTNTGTIRQLSRLATADSLRSATSDTLKLDNQKNGWKGVCVHHHANGELHNCPVRALARRVIHIRAHTSDAATFLSAFYINHARFDVSDNDIRNSVKSAATILNYPSEKGIPIQRIDTHSLRSGGANALSLSGYSDREIQKMGRWRGATFKEYIREELACFSSGMSEHMARQFNFVNIAGGAYHDVTPAIITRQTTPNTPLDSSN